MISIADAEAGDDAVETGSIELQDEERSGMSWIATLFNLTNTSIGAGSLALPYVLHECGLVLGLILIVVVACLSWFGLYFLTCSKNLCHQRSFMGVAKYADGVRGEKLASLAMFLMLLGPLSAYFEICGSYMRTFIEAYGGHHQHQWYTSSIFIMAVIGLFIMLPLSFKSLKSLSYGSMLALGAMIYAILLVPILYLVARSDPEWKPPPARLIHLGWSVLSGFSTIGMAFVNHAIVVESTSALDNPTHYRQHSLTTAATVITTILYLIISTSGYLHFGDNITGNILDSESEAFYVQIARVAVSLGVALTFPLLVIPARECLEILRGRHEADYSLLGSDETDQIRYRRTRFRKVMHTCFIVILAFSIAVLVPGLDKIFAFFGSLTGSLIVYILPVYFFLLISRRFGLIEVRDGWRVSVVSGLHFDGSPVLTVPDTPDFDNRRRSYAIPEEERFHVHPWVVQCAIYLNVVVGLILFIFGTGFSLIDLFG